LLARSSNLPAGSGLWLAPYVMLFTWSHRAGTRSQQKRCPANPCLFGLAPCGVYRAATVTSRAVGSYPTLSPLPQAACMDMPLAEQAQQPEAVCFLLHWPYLRLETQAPDVIRHTALRSSDFPPPPDGKPREAAIIRPPALLQLTGNSQQRTEKAMELAAAQLRRRLRIGLPAAG